MTRRKKFENPEVAAVFKSYPRDIRTKLISLRQLIFDVASITTGVGELEETLKWGQPSYITTKSKSGTLIRIDQIKSQDGKYAMYFHCQTTLVNSFKKMYGDELTFDGNRSIILNGAEQTPVKQLRHCISLALTYHLDKKLRRATAFSKRIIRRSYSQRSA